MPRRGVVVSLDEMRERIYRYIVAGETVGGLEAFMDRPGWHPGNFEVLVEYGIKLLIFLGLEERVTLQSIFTPPVLEWARSRAMLLSMVIEWTLAGFQMQWVRDHGPPPAASAWGDEVATWHVVWMSWGHGE